MIVLTKLITSKSLRYVLSVTNNSLAIKYALSDGL